MGSSVNTVSGPFHPFVGAVDIIVVEQQDGTYKSSPWYVHYRFQKFLAGVLNRREKVVSVSVNGIVAAGFHMYFDHKGDAFFASVRSGPSWSSDDSSAGNERTPTSPQLASLQLNQGENTVVFTFSTTMMGNQQVEARIFLWRWDTRVVISDVDGTITRSDFRGQVKHLVGKDWIHKGVAHLFSAIKENGYQLLFLSSRSIYQCLHTREFLRRIKQDGEDLPEGPVIVSPDGMRRCFIREVIGRPDEFKIRCLQDIKALFPHDRSPFYAGFGNKDTDELSYRDVGIPREKIFTINRKLPGEIVVDSLVYNNSYSSLHSLVHDMFQPTSSQQEEHAGGRRCR